MIPLVFPSYTIAMWVLFSRGGNFAKKTKARKTRKITNAKILTFTVVYAPYT